MGQFRKGCRRNVCKEDNLKFILFNANLKNLSISQFELPILNYTEVLNSSIWFKGNDHSKITIQNLSHDKFNGFPIIKFRLLSRKGEETAFRQLEQYCFQSESRIFGDESCWTNVNVKIIHNSTIQWAALCIQRTSHCKDYTTDNPVQWPM